MAKKLSRLPGQYYRFDPFPAAEANMHVTTYLLSTLAVLGIAPMDIAPKVCFSAQAAEKRQKNADRIAVHPGSGSSSKNWSASHYAALCHKLSKEHGAQIVLISGPAEKKVISHILSECPGAGFKLLERMPLVEIARELRDCTFYVGNDSGISHLAAALGIPCLVIFRSSNPTVWRPIGRDVCIVQDESILGGAPLSVGHVYDQIRQQIRS